MFHSQIAVGTEPGVKGSRGARSHGESNGWEEEEEEEIAGEDDMESQASKMYNQELCQAIFRREKYACHICANQVVW